MELIEIPQQNIHVVQEVGTLEEVYEALAKLQKTLRYLLNGNLDFENLRARSIKADNIEVGTLTAEEIKANSISADRMDVDKLSAITADLGHITAGLIEAIDIFGSYIATSRSYPRAEMSNTQNLIGAYGDARKYVKVDSNPNTLGAPMVNFGFNGIETWLTQISSGFLVFGPNSNVSFSVNNLSLGGKVQVSGSNTKLGSASALVPTTPEEAVTSVTVLIAVLRGMGILA